MTRLDDLERAVRRLENMQGVNGVLVHVDEGGVTVALADRPHEPELLPEPGMGWYAKIIDGRTIGKDNAFYHLNDEPDPPGPEYAPPYGWYVDETNYLGTVIYPSHTRTANNEPIPTVVYVGNRFVPILGGPPFLIPPYVEARSTLGWDTTTATFYVFRPPILHQPTWVKVHSGSGNETYFGESFECVAGYLTVYDGSAWYDVPRSSKFVLLQRGSTWAQPGLGIDKGHSYPTINDDQRLLCIMGYSPGHMIPVHTPLMLQGVVKGLNTTEIFTDSALNDGDGGLWGNDT